MSEIYRINQQIKANEVRLLRHDGTQVGVVSMTEALTLANEQNVDAVEIAPLASPPVVKLIDYKKFLYQLAKKERASKAAAKKVDIKEVRLTPFMAENDFQTKINRGREFLLEGHKIRLSVKFVGRQLSRREFGPQLMQRALTALSDIAAFDTEPKWVGRQFSGTLTPIKKK